jgi:hypothetical protein
MPAVLKWQELLLQQCAVHQHLFQRYSIDLVEPLLYRNLRSNKNVPSLLGISELNMLLTGQVCLQERTIQRVCIECWDLH